MQKLIFILSLIFALTFSLTAQRGGGHYHGGHHGHYNNHHGHYNSHHNHHYGYSNHRHRNHNHGYNYGWSPVCRSDFNVCCNSIRNCRLDSDRLNCARRYLRRHYFTVHQIRCILDMMQYDNNRLAFAKYAYARCADRNNYYQLYSCLSYQSNRRALECHLRGY